MRFYSKCFKANITQSISFTISLCILQFSTLKSELWWEGKLAKPFERQVGRASFKPENHVPGTHSMKISASI